MKQAIVFAAGLGTRLKPLTDTKPKVLVELDGKPILEHVLDKLIDHDFRKIVVNTHYFAEQIEEFISQKDFDAEIIVSYEEEVLETGGGLVFAKDYFDDGDILIHNGDILSDINVSELWDFHKDNSAIATLASFPRKSLREFLWDEEDKLCGWRNLSSGEYKWSRETDEFLGQPFAAVHVVSKKIIELLPEEGKFSLVPYYLEIAKNNNIKRWEAANSFWFDIGSVEKLKAAEEFLHSK